MKKIFLNTILFICLSFVLNAQQNLAKTIASKLDARSKLLPIEKLYLNFDKPYYLSGDTIWFKTYLLNASLQANAISKKVYIELVNDSNQVKERKSLLIVNGVAWGDFALKDIPQGNYIIRAYTNLQQNFKDDYFFIKQFNIGQSNESSWLLSSTQQIENKGSSKNLNFTAKLTSLKNTPIGFKDVYVTLMNGKKNLFKNSLQTSVDGVLKASFKIEDEGMNNNMQVIIQDKLNKTQKVIIPITQPSPDKIDLQFLPEGGDMVNGINGKIAFKATGEDGRGVNIKGKIFNGKNEVVVNFESQHNGMGSFYLLPATGENYVAKVSMPNTSIQSFNLPIVKKEGTALRIDNYSNLDSIYVYIRATESIRTDKLYSLIAQNENNTVYATNISLKNGFYNTRLAKKSFPDGITHFTVFDSDFLPLNERLIMTGALEKVNMLVSSSKNEFEPLDSIAIQLRLTDQNNLPLSNGSYSVSVTDDNQIKLEDYPSTIFSHYLLTSSLKGNIEEPEWYFRDKSPVTQLALDHLLLTQGWVGYHWESMLIDSQFPKFKPETSIAINGRLNTVLNSPLPNRKVNLLSLGKVVIFQDTISNKEGLFSFNDLPPLDSVAYLIKAKTANNKSSAAIITVNEFIPTLLKAPFNQKIKPWYVNSDPITFNYAKTVKQRVLAYTKKYNQLREVVILGKKTFTPAGSIEEIPLKRHITEAELKKVPRRTLLELLREKVPGFGVVPRFYIESPMFGAFADVLIDGLSTKLLGENDFDASNRFLFSFMNAEDIKDVKAFRGSGAAFLLITTRSGAGPFIRRTPGVYVYRPIPFAIPKTFYSPKYAVKPTESISDTRATLFWEPNLIPDQDGKISFSFYASEKPTTYTVIIEGTDFNGKFAYQKSTITIKNKTESK
ncbi:hypothetical protein WG904_19545 [Pedobacter sp. Du54]|uniref:hypothetical protein n=1 Tax=Pedobacter anseongensis TaxID=3133439 RepID=UPI0030B75507